MPRHSRGQCSSNQRKAKPAYDNHSVASDSKTYESDSSCEDGSRNMSDEEVQHQDIDSELESDVDLAELDPFEVEIRPKRCRIRPSEFNQHGNPHDSRRRRRLAAFRSNLNDSDDDCQIGPSAKRHCPPLLADAPSTDFIDVPAPAADSPGQLISDMIKQAQRQAAQQALALSEFTRRRALLQQAISRPERQVCCRGTRYCKSEHDLQWEDRPEDLRKFDDVMQLLFEVHPKCQMSVDADLAERLQQPHDDDFLEEEYFTIGVKAANLFSIYRSVFERRGASLRSTWWTKRNRQLPQYYRLSRNRFSKCCHVRLCTLKPQNRRIYLGIRRHRLHN